MSYVSQLVIQDFFCFFVNPGWAEAPILALGVFVKKSSDLRAERGKAGWSETPLLAAWPFPPPHHPLLPLSKRVSCSRNRTIPPEALCARNFLNCCLVREGGIRAGAKMARGRVKKVCLSLPNEAVEAEGDGSGGEWGLSLLQC